MAYPASSIANEILKRTRNHNIDDVTPMKLQKLVYFAHGWWLGVTGKPLIAEQVEAWQYGPVVPSLYEATKEFGNQPIPAPLLDYVVEDNNVVEITQQVENTETVDDPDEDAVVSLLEWVIKEYGDKSGIALSNLSHIKGGPWDITVNNHLGSGQMLPKSTDISAELIRNYFQAQAGNMAVLN